MTIFAVQNTGETDMESYDDKKEEKTASIASEPQVSYGNTQTVIPCQLRSSDKVPKGYMSLEQFGELFHQKLDECYAHLPSSN